MKMMTKMVWVKMALQSRGQRSLDQRLQSADSSLSDNINYQNDLEQIEYINSRGRPLRKLLTRTKVFICQMHYISY